MTTTLVLGGARSGKSVHAEALATAAGRDVVWVPGALRVLFTGLSLLPRWAWRRLPR